MNLIKKISINNLTIDSLVIIFLSHIYYKITFVNFLQGEFLLINQIKAGNVTSTLFSVESPTYVLIGLLLGIDNIDNFKLLIYLITLISFGIIVINIQFLNSYSTLFLFGGWLVTCSWYIGYVDAVSVMLIVLITRNIIQENNGKLNLLIYITLLTINHSAISLAIIIISLLFIKKGLLKKYLVIAIISQLLGNGVIQYYLNYIGFSGRGRFRFIFNDNIIETATSFVGNNILIILWSGFLGVSFLIVLASNMLLWVDVSKVLLGTLIAIFFTAISLDTSRIFSLLVIPIILNTLQMCSKKVELNKYISIIYTFSLILFFFIGVYHFFGEVYKSSPMINDETFYDLIVRMVNSLMSGIWK
jgi:hypothetical protein